MISCYRFQEYRKQLYIAKEHFSEPFYKNFSRQIILTEHGKKLVVETLIDAINIHGKLCKNCTGEILNSEETKKND